MKEKIPHMITSIDAENAFAKIQRPFLTENIQQPRNRRELILKAIMKNPPCVSYETVKY